jgi:hypothetical protein
LSAEDERVLGKLDPELLNYGSFYSKGKPAELSRTARRLLLALEAEYWKERTHRVVDRMLEANIAVMNGSRIDEKSQDPLFESELETPIPTVAQRLQERVGLDKESTS